MNTYTSKLLFISISIILAILAYSFSTENRGREFKKEKYTIYRATINNKLVTCNVVEHSKLGYNLLNCTDDNIYFNVTNIEMTVGERNAR